MLNKFYNARFFEKHKKLILLILIVFFVGCSYIIDQGKSSSPEKFSTPSDFEIDTYIPSGFVLVPIEIQNLNAVDSIIGQFGVIDLYVPGSKKPLSRGLKLIRSPKDPSQFAVLVRDQISDKIVQLSHKPFQVIVQNPKSVISDKNTTIQPKIQWED